jgi:histidinol-phosphate aminotransferase
MILVDEAYFHYADSAPYESVIPVVAGQPNLMVTRTFSKIYGMVGLRCGYCVVQHEVIERLRAHQPWDSVNIMALAAAIASMDDAGQGANGHRWNSEACALVTGELDAMGYKSFPPSKLHHDRDEDAGCAAYSVTQATRCASWAVVGAA